MMKFLNKLFPQTANLKVNIKPTIGVVKENPKLEELRAQAKDKMEKWGRKSLLEGGEFSLNNNVLNAHRQTRQATMGA